MPDCEQRAKENEVDKMVANLDSPNLQAMPGKEFIDQIGRRNETQPKHEAGHRAGDSRGYPSP